MCAIGAELNASIRAPMIEWIQKLAGYGVFWDFNTVLIFMYVMKRRPDYYWTCLKGRERQIFFEIYFSNMFG